MGIQEYQEKPAQNLSMTVTGNPITVKANKCHLIPATPGDRISIECNVTNYLKGNTSAVIKRTNQTRSKSRANCFSRPYGVVSCCFSDTTMEPVSLWADTGKSNGKGLSLKIMLTPIPRPHTTPTATPTAYQSAPYPVTPTTDQTTYPLISKIGPYAIKYTGQQQVLFNPSWPLKRVELSMQVDRKSVV